MNCTRIIQPIVHHVWPLALRAIRRRIRKHAHHAVAAGVTIVCAGTPPAALWVALPPMGVMVPAPGAVVVRPAAASALLIPPAMRIPVDVPEPGSLAVLAVGGIAVVLLRSDRRSLPGKRRP